MTEEVRRRLGPQHSANMVIRAYDFAEIEALQAAGDWAGAGRLLAEDARHLQAAGADLLVLCTNTMHRVADEIQAAVDIPLLHIADATGEAVRAAGVRTVGLLGTRYTMEQDFYRGRLEERHGLAVMVPDEPDRTLVHDVIYAELVRGVIREESRRAFLAVIERLINAARRGSSPAARRSSCSSAPTTWRSRTSRRPGSTRSWRWSWRCDMRPDRHLGDRGRGHGGFAGVIPG